MEMFNETDDFDEVGDEVILIEPKSPTEVRVFVGGEDGEMAFVVKGSDESRDDDGDDAGSGKVCKAAGKLVCVIIALELVKT